MNNLISLRHVVVLTLLLAAFVLQTNGQVVTAIFERMEKHRQALQTLKADIKTGKYNRQLDEWDKSEGKISAILKSSYMRIDYTKPREQTISVAKGKFIAFTPSTNEAYTGSSGSEKVRSKGPGALTLLQMSKAELKKDFVATQLPNETFDGTATFHLRFTPKAASRYKYFEVWVDQDGMIRQIKEMPTSGDESYTQLSNIEKNKALKPADFVVTLPPGVKPKPM